MQTLSYYPGQVATILLEIKDADGYFIDSLTTPLITHILGFTAVDGYSSYDGYCVAGGTNQQPMTKISTGNYFGKFTLPKTSTSLGSYLVNVQYQDPINNFLKSKNYSLMLNAPHGNFGPVAPYVSTTTTPSNNSGTTATLKQILANGNITDGYNIVISTGNQISITDPPANNTAAVNKFYADTHVGTHLVDTSILPSQDGYALAWNQTSGQWQPRNTINDIKTYVDGYAVQLGDAAGGDLTATYPNPVVSRLQTRAVSSVAPADGYTLTWNANLAAWIGMPPNNLISMRVGADLPNANTAINVNDGVIRPMNAQSVSRTITLDATGAVLGSVIIIPNRSVLTLNVVNNGGTPGALTGVLSGFCRSYRYNGTNWIEELNWQLA